jgi:putative component of membrane protein insertase Oxa1/YidC/SpoIIIJ protein YidD
MKLLILLTIRFYWFTKSKNSKPKCIFRKSCSHYVYEITQDQGLLKGLKAFVFRYENCRGYIQIFKNPINNKTNMLLSSRIIIEEDEIAERLLIK